MSGVGEKGWPLVGAETMRALDRHTIEDLGVPGELLMESAGRALAQSALSRLPVDANDAEVCVVCGGGNNAGDGFVAARHLHQLGTTVRIVPVVPPERLRGDAARNWKRAQALGVAVDGPRWRAPQRGVIIDAIFGTGLSRKVEGAAASAIRRIERARSASCQVVSIDLPSGLDADTGQVHGLAVSADCTLTVSLPKLGLALEPGRSLAGEVFVARVGIADSAPKAAPQAELWTPAAAAAQLPAREASGHKGSFGHVLVLAGSEGKTGAAALAADAALRAGAGLVTLACPAGLNDILEIKCTEAMTVPVADTPERALSATAEDTILALAAERDVVAAGPGLGRHPETQSLLRALAKRLECPLVLDADGLFAFGDDTGGGPAALRAGHAPRVITPHPGEAARLLGCRAGDVNLDRIGAARRLAEASGAVTLLKGAASVVADVSGRVVVNPTGGPILGTGGTGDVLTGLVAAYLAQGAAPFEAAALAAYVHGAAADALCERLGPSGALAGEVSEAVPGAVAALRRRGGVAALEQGEAPHERGFVLPFPGP